MHNHASIANPIPSSTTVDRRGWTKQTIGSLLTYSLLQSVLRPEALAEGVLDQKVASVAGEWLTKVNGMSRELKQHSLSQTQWQKQVESLFAQVDLQEFLRFTDFEKLIQSVRFKERGERSFRPTFPKVEGLPTDLVFGHQMFALKENQSVVPHGHYNMATAFLVLRGSFVGKHYDRVEDHDDHFIIRPTIDRKFDVGGCSTVSDHKDNVHWFKATSETAYIFNIHVLNIDPDIKRSGRVYMDPEGESLADGLVKAPRLQAAEAYRRFG